MDRTIHNRQVGRARKLLNLKEPEEIKKGPNDVKRFMKRVTQTKSGEKATVEYVIDEAKIAEEEKYDSYYAVATNLLPMYMMLIIEHSIMEARHLMH